MVRPELRARRVCAIVLTAIVSNRTRIKGELRFIKCIFLTVRRIVNSGDACELPHGPELSISAAVLSRRSLTMHGKRKA